jgi:CRISPR/Cas system CSM-associated protein Csm3 (group 7 of RAMP superfamily)
MEKRKNHIQYRYYVKGKLKILSPLIIASGEDELADLQLIRDWDGNIIIPGTTLAGNIRHLLQEKIKDKKIMDQYFGSEAENSGHSLFSFFDASALSVDTDIRDGVKLDNLTKTTKDKSKYDYEIINTGSVFEFRMEAVSRKNSDNIIVEAILSEIIELLEKSVLRIGAKTSRGFGRIQLAQTKTLKLEMAKDQDKQKWINFSWNDLNTKDEFKTRKDLFDEINNFKISATFTIPDSLIIKSYSTEPDDVDSVSLTSNEKTVVSGTSWNGAIRHALENAGRELGKHEEMLKLIHKTFGWVDDENRNKKAVPSKVIIEENTIEDSIMIPYIRNKVDRFTGGVVESALFDEKSVYGGSVQLNCEIKNAEDFEKGMLILAIKELQNGIQTVGGGSNIGRGRLETKDPVNISDEDQQRYLDALAVELNNTQLNREEKNNSANVI